eukprot:384212-Lingulodinium_polyedra.AAC.1
MRQPQMPCGSHSHSMRGSGRKPFSRPWQGIGPTRSVQTCWGPRHKVMGAMPITHRSRIVCHCSKLVDIMCKITLCKIIARNECKTHARWPLRTTGAPCTGRAI